MSSRDRHPVEKGGLTSGQTEGARAARVIPVITVGRLAPCPNTQARPAFVRGLAAVWSEGSTFPFGMNTVRGPRA
jgi:hypothetical protein